MLIIIRSAALFLIISLLTATIGSAADDYEPSALGFVNNLRKNFSKKLEDLTDYPAWPIFTWSEDRPRRLLAIQIPSGQRDRRLSELEGNLEISYLRDLKTLKIQKQNLSKIKVHDLPNLTELDLSRNRCSGLMEGLYRLPRLRRMDLSRNKIDRIHPLEGVAGLTALDLSSNPITKIEGLSALTALEDLNLRGLKITEIQGLESLAGLRKLDLGKTSISAVEGLAGLNKLESLYLDNTRLRSLLRLPYLPSLKNLNISRTGISGLSDLSNLPALENLDLTETPVRSLESLGGLSGLRRLSIRPRVSGEPAAIVLKDLDRLENLEELSIVLSGSPKLEGLDNLLKLKKLFISDYAFEEMEGLARLGQLEELTLINCWAMGCGSGPTLKKKGFRKISGLSGLGRLQFLNLSSNRIESIEGLNSLGNLRHLNLRGNLIEKIEGLDNLRQLEQLNLSLNRITKIEAIGQLVSLKSLDLSVNPIDDFAVLSQPPPGLRSLNVGSCRLPALDVLAGFDKLRGQLSCLNARGNNLSGHLDLGPWAKLDEIDLESNRFSSLSGYEQLKTDSKINLYRNSLPLSQLYPLCLDHSGRKWIISDQVGVGGDAELRLGEAYDLSGEYKIEGKATNFQVWRNTQATDRSERNESNWKIAREESYENQQGRFIFKQPGRYFILMSNHRVRIGQPSLKSGNIIIVKSGLISVTP